MDSLSAHCAEEYTVDVKVNIMEGALGKYKDPIANGYDKQFEIYAHYIAEQVSYQVDEFMKSNKADNYFQCTEDSLHKCCNDCNHSTCMLDCVKGDDCEPGYSTNNIKCPTIVDSGIFSDDSLLNVTYHLEDAEGFWKYIGEEYGIEESWIKVDRKLARSNNGSQYAGKYVQGCLDRKNNWYYGYPLGGEVKVYNPKYVIGDSYDKSEDLLDRIRTVKELVPYVNITFSDLVDAVSLPALSSEVAIKSMKSIVETAEKIEKARREEILGFISDFLFFVPLIGQAAGAVGMTAVRSMLRLIGSAGEAGMALYDVVVHPESAFMSVFFFLADAGVSLSGFKKAAGSRQSITSNELDGLGSVKKSLERIQNIRTAGVCRL